MKNVDTLKLAALVTVSSIISACSTTPKPVAEPPVLAAAVSPPAFEVPAAPIVETPRGPSITLNDILFDFDDSTLRPEAASTVRQAAEYLQSNPERTALIEGHTDHVGDSDFNQNLSVARSESMKEALLSLGVSETRIKTTGLGETSPIANNNTQEGRQANRRVEVVFVVGENSN